MNTISKVFGALAFALLLAACDFHGPWEYYPEERDVYTGIYTYGYILSEGSPDVCFSKVYELDEVSTKDGRLRVYCVEKTLADCFKFRNAIGLDVAIAALRDAREKKDGRKPGGGDSKERRAGLQAHV